MWKVLNTIFLKPTDLMVPGVDYVSRLDPSTNIEPIGVKMDDKTLITLVERFGSSQLAELELNDGTMHLVLRKENALHPAPANTSPAQSADHPTLHLGLPVNAGSPASTGEIITSPIVATFYRSASPDAPPFVEVGTRAKAGQTLCILEAMKMMNHLEAEFDCEILSVKAENGSLVEYGQPLFEVKRL